MKQSNQINERFNLIKILLLCVISAVVIVSFYIIAIRSQVFAGIIPNIAIFCIFGTIGAAITQLGYMLYHSRKVNGRISLKAILGLKTKLSVKEYLIWVPLLIVVTLGLFWITGKFGVFIQNTFYGWVPEWFVFETDYSIYGAASAGVTFALVFFGTSIVFPIIEELFFRGFLLPRMAWLGKWAVLVNVVIFSVYHFWSPWLIISRAVSLLPLFYVVKWKDSLSLAIWVHCCVNIIADVILPAVALL